MSSRFPPAAPALCLALCLTACSLEAQDPAGSGRRPASAQEAGEATGDDRGETMSDSPTWKEVDRLISEQKLQAALERLGELRAEARRAGDDEEWTRALVREVQLRTGLHGYETAVRFLRQEPWPETPRYRLALELFYARSLVNYLHAYSWEIAQRERVVSSDELDLKAWTREQIFHEAQRAYVEAWERRGSWGGESLGSLAEYVEQNDYPARIRGTLRDAVTYLWVELLADTTFWRPEQSNELYRLDFEALLEGDPERAEAIDLASPEVHPLVKIGALLADLEGWHRGHDRPEAAFEARLERLRRLRDSFSHEDERAAIRRNLERHLEALGRHFPWWSMGKSLDAEMARDEGGPWSLVRAREIALEGQEAHPESVGGRRCRHLVAAIEAPSYSLAAMSSDGLGRRSIELTHQSLEAIHFRAYPIDLLATIEKAQDRNLLPGYREVEKIVGSRRPALEWSVELPPTPDYRSHKTYVTPPIETPGAYLVVASARRDFDPGRNQLVALNVLLGDLVLLTRRDEAGYEVTVRSGDSGRALAGVEVDLYRLDWRQGHARVESAVTSADGRVRFRDAGWDRERHFLLARRGEELAIDLAHLGRIHRPEPGESTATLLYTDRSVYRPEQTLYFKVVTYRNEVEPGRFSLLPDTEVGLDLLDPNFEVVESLTVRTNAFGSASGEIEIPAGRLLGSWRLNTSLGGSTEVLVEEYKRPTFEVTLAEPAEPLRLNRPATLGGEARYYFGLPVTAGEASWRVTREPLYPPWWSWWYPRPQASPQTLAAGTAELDAEGTFELTFTPEADEREADDGVTYRFRLSVDVTDADGGETRSASRAFRLGFVAVEASIRRERGFFVAGEGGELEVERRDLDGSPRPGAGSYRLLALDVPEETLLPAEMPLPPPPAEEGERAPYVTEGDLLRPRWAPSYDPRAVLRRWDDGEVLRAGRLEHGPEGLAAVELGELAPGAYRLVYTTEDAYGARFETREEFLVAPAGGARLELPLPALLLAEVPSVPVGGTARFLAHSGLEDQPLVLELYRDGETFRRRDLGSETGAHLVEVAIDEGLRGGFGASLAALRDHQLMHLTESLFVPWDDRRLKLEMASFRDRLRPGAHETWRITVRGDDEALLERGAAEVLAYMYDRSLDVFAPHQPPQPLGLYPSRIGGFFLRSTLGIAQVVWQQGRGLAAVPAYPVLSGDRLKFYDGYAIGGPGARGGRMEMMRMRMPSSPAPEMAMAQGRAAEGEMMEELKVADAALAKSAEAPPPPGEAPPEGPEEPVPLRSDFAETAFWKPHLIVGADGSVSFEFTVPDSVTEWNVWAHALTRDLRAGSLSEKAQSVKDLLVRPYLPRFLREGDRAEIKVVVNNAGNRTLEGRLDFDVRDPETDESLLAAFGLDPEAAAGVPFSVPPGGGADLVFEVTAPRRVGPVAFRASARAGDLSDGELRPLPVLPSRLHLSQSRFAALHDQDRRRLTFDDMRRPDPSREDELLVVTLDGQLFYSLLDALPYLVAYPYECTEQSLNRFLSTGILTSLFDQYPAVAEMARKLAERETRYEVWGGEDPNRKMLLEETPWLQLSQGRDPGGGDEPPLLKVLDPEVAAAQRAASLAELRKAQTSLGAFPWWPGGPPSPYMTLYLLYGFSKALEFEVEVPREMVERAWAYMHRHYLDELARRMLDDDCCWETITFLNYVLSSYPDASWTGGVFSDDDRRRMLEFSFRHWKRHSPMLKGYLTLTLERAGRGEDARLVWESVMDSARTERDLGTFWAPEDRSWLWYNDTIETHAAALRVLMEVDADDERRHGLVQWLMLNKKLNHWKSTRATAEVIYSVAHYLQAEEALAVREEARVEVGPRIETFVFEPDEYTGKKNQLVLADEEIDPATMSTVEVSKETPGFLFASATWHFSTEELPAEARGDFFQVERRYFRRRHDGRDWVLEPLAEGERLEVGDQVEVQVSLRSKHAAEYVHLRDPRGAGLEPETTTSGYKWDLGIGWYEEVRDSGTSFFFERLPVGEYTFKYRLRANLAGSFRVGPAQVQSMYAPEFVAYSSGARLAIQADDEQDR